MSDILFDHGKLEAKFTFFMFHMSPSLKIAGVENPNIFSQIVRYEEPLDTTEQTIYGNE